MDKISPLIRTAIFVRDLERAHAFYRDVMGLEDIYFQGDYRDETMNKLLGVTADKLVRCIIVKVPGPNFGMVGLFEIEDLDDAPPTDPSKLRIGEGALVFYTADIMALYDRLQADGAYIVCPPQMLTVTEEISQLEMTFRDPDGMLVNAINRDPSVAHKTTGIL